MSGKTAVEEIDRTIYDIHNEDADAYRLTTGLSREIVLKLSEEKNDPEWMRDFRLQCLDIYNNTEMRDWGPDISGRGAGRRLSGLRKFAPERVRRHGAHALHEARTAYGP